MVTVLTEDFFMDKFQRLLYILNNQTSNTSKQTTQNVKQVHFGCPWRMNYTRKDSENPFLI